MNSVLKISALTLVTATLISGCASNGPTQTSTPYSAPYSTPYSSSNQSRNSNIGVIESIQITRAEHTSNGAGAVVGGLVGGLLGNQVGSGNGRTAATIAGAVGGAVVGNNVEKNRNTPTSDMYQIRVRLDNGDSTTVVQDSIQDLRVGNRVRVVDGRAYLY